MAIIVLVGAVVIGWLSWRSYSADRQLKEMSKVTVNKEPVNFANRTFDPASPPPDMPPLNAGEAAACDTDYESSATVGGQTRLGDATHATLTVTNINVKLMLNITIWTAKEATPRVIEHEQGHREISEFYYQTADKIAEKIAAGYLERRVEIAGTDLQAEGNKALQQMAAEINEEYKRELNPGPAQLLYDEITEHSRNDVVVKDAVEHAIKNAAVESR
jgi:hypothetical protein